MLPPPGNPSSSAASCLKGRRKEKREKKKRKRSEAKANAKPTPLFLSLKAPPPPPSIQGPYPLLSVGKGPLYSLSSFPCLSGSGLGRRTSERDFQPLPQQQVSNRQKPRQEPRRGHGPEREPHLPRRRPRRHRRQGRRRSGRSAGELTGASLIANPTQFCDCRCRKTSAKSLQLAQIRPFISWKLPFNMVGPREHTIVP